VRLLKIILALLPFLLFSSRGWAQRDDAAVKGRRGSRILDDTTKQVYGPGTSRYFYESDFFYNRNIVSPIDTLIKDFHRYNYVQRNLNFYQDLGNIGTAIRPIFYKSPDVVGVRSGMDVYDLYWDSELVEYFDTKSPYSNMNVVLGGRGRSLTKIVFSRNINPRWNFGFTYRGFFIDKQVPERRGKGDRITRSNYYDFFTSYHAKDSIYSVFANFQRMMHGVEEYGGVRAIAPDSSFDAYFGQNILPWLSAAKSKDHRINVHFHHQLRVGSALQVYHTLDRYRQRAKFIDDYKTDSEFFPFVNIENDKTNDIGKFKVVRNEAGIKGNLLKLFYNGYYAIRHYNMTYNHWTQDSLRVPARGDENYLGGRIELNLDSLGLLNGWAEVNEEGNYRIQGKLVSRWFEASLRQLLYKPSFLEQAYTGAHHEWNNEFANVESSQINGYLHYRSKTVGISPGLTFTRLRNYVFFDQVTKVDSVQQVFPVQSNGNQIYFTPELRFSVKFFRHVMLTNQTLYTFFAENANDAIRVPELFVNTQLAYSNIHFDGNLDMQAGVEVHWHSAYYAPAYDPAIRQFYNQDDFRVNAFPVVDLFFNAKIKRARILFKWNNLVQLVTTTGYFPTPLYPGQRNVIDFGFDWSFYD